MLDRTTSLSVDLTKENAFDVVIGFIPKLKSVKIFLVEAAGRTPMKQRFARIGESFPYNDSIWI